MRAKAVQCLSEGLPTVLQQDALLLQPILMTLKARCSFRTCSNMCIHFQSGDFNAFTDAPDPFTRLFTISLLLNRVQVYEETRLLFLAAIHSAMADLPKYDCSGRPDTRRLSDKAPSVRKKALHCVFVLCNALAAGQARSNSMDMAAVSSPLFRPLGLLINPPHKYPLAPADGERQVAYYL